MKVLVRLIYDFFVNLSILKYKGKKNFRYFVIFDPDMANRDNRMMRRRLMNAYLSSVISISLVLLLVGVASMLLVNAKGVSDYFKENMQISVMMNPGRIRLLAGVPQARGGSAGSPT